MSVRTASTRNARKRGAQLVAQRRRRLLGLGLVVVILVAGFSTVLPRVDHAVKEVTLPLRHEDIIRQQAKDKDVDASLIAGVIYAESRFRDQTSHAGARGLMQITPATAQEIAQKSGGIAF